MVVVLSPFYLYLYLRGGLRPALRPLVLSQSAENFVRLKGEMKLQLKQEGNTHWNLQSEVETMLVCSCALHENSRRVKQAMHWIPNERGNHVALGGIWTEKMDTTWKDVCVSRQ